jgi:predicted transglutaminase-like cysteine proteinase
MFTAFRTIRGAASHMSKLTLAAAMVMGFATPSHAIDARRPDAGLLPTKVVVSAPQGASNLCDAYAWACAKGDRALLVDKAVLDLANQINRKANRSVRSVSDLQQYRVAERWSLPTKRGGDCEDYALYKKLELIKAGFAPQQLLIATVLDRKGGSHAVLVLRTGTQDLVLDNLTSVIKPWQKTGYTFLRLQNPENPSQWVSVFAGGMFDKIS